MSDVTNSELLEMIKAMQASTGNATGGRSRMSDPAIEVESVSVPVKLDLGRETVRVYLNCKASPSSQRDLTNLVDDLFDAGYEVDTWQKKRDYNSGGRGRR
jgi:hypothetical protein